MSTSKKTGKCVDKSSLPTDPNAVGYQHPPTNTRFTKGKSGNPRGRPNGHRNLANLTKDLLSRSVRVRSGGETLEMRAIEAIFRVLVNKATQGNSRATSLVNKLREMGGLTDEMTEEERQKRGMRLPRAFTTYEMDLVIAPARERDRQRYLAMAESDEADSELSDDHASTTELVPPAINAGDKLAAQGNVDEALAAYRSQLALCKTKLTADSNNNTAQYNFRRAVARIGLLADSLLRAGEFEKALQFADEAIAEAASGFWILPDVSWWPSCANTGWINLIRAYARMFLGRTDEARAYLLGFLTNKRNAETSWENAILRDFVQMRRMGYLHPLMGEIETHFAAAGWALETRQDFPPRIDRAFTHAADIKLADALAKQSKLDEAVIAYRRILEDCKTDLAKDGTDRLAQAELNIVADRIGRLARHFLLVGNFAEAFHCADEALDREPYSTALNLNRAHALMFLGKLDEARGIYFEYHGKKMGRRHCQEAIREDFETLRKAGRSHKLMTEVEGRFAGAKWDERLSAMAGDDRASPASHEIGAYDCSVEEGPPSRTAALAARAYSLQTKPSILPLSEREDIASGDELLLQGHLDEALAVYKRRIERCDQILANGVHNIQARDDKYLVLNKISDISLRFLLAGQDEKALTTVDYALSVLPLSSYPNVRRAHALMFLGKEHEARELYIQYREQKMSPEQTGESVILQDFDQMRKFDRVNTLMDEITSLFKTPKLKVQLRTCIR